MELSTRESLVNKTYNKLFIPQQAWKMRFTNAPIHILLKNEDWRYWCMDGSLCIAYNPGSAQTYDENAYWHNRACLSDAVPRFYGDIVVFRWGKDIKLDWAGFHLHCVSFLYDRYIVKSKSSLKLLARYRRKKYIKRHV